MVFIWSRFSSYSYPSIFFILGLAKACSISNCVRGFSRIFPADIAPRNGGGKAGFFHGVVQSPFPFGRAGPVHPGGFPAFLQARFIAALAPMG